MDIQKLCAKLRNVKNLSKFARDCDVSRRTLVRLRGGWDNPTHDVLRKVEEQLRKGKQ